MTKQEFLNELEDVLEIPRSSLREEESLKELAGWDSMAVVTYITMVDEYFDLTLQPIKISEAKTVADLLGLVEDRFCSSE